MFELLSLFGAENKDSEKKGSFGGVVDWLLDKLGLNSLFRGLFGRLKKDVEGSRPAPPETPKKNLVNISSVRNSAGNVIMTCKATESKTPYVSDECYSALFEACEHYYREYDQPMEILGAFRTEEAQGRIGRQSDTFHFTGCALDIAPSQISRAIPILQEHGFILEAPNDPRERNHVVWQPAMAAYNTPASRLERARAFTSALYV